MNPGSTNPYGQRILRFTALPGTDPDTSLWILECDHCGYVYGSNNTDAPHRKCRHCQHGPPALPVPTERDAEPWNRDDHLIAFNLYNQIPFGAIVHNPKVIGLAALLARSTGSVTSKLADFARLDPVLRTRAAHPSPRNPPPEEQLWNEFTAHPETVAFESFRLLADRRGQPLELVADITTSDLPTHGADRDTLLRLRVVQSFFRRRVLSAYEFRCCVTGLRQPDLLVATHIVRSAANAALRLDPKNSLCLNALHAQAFQRGLMWIDDNFTVKFSNKLRQIEKKPDPTLTWITSFDGKPLQLPKVFRPDPDLLRRHAEFYRDKKQTIKRSVAPWGPI